MDSQKLSKLELELEKYDGEDKVISSDEMKKRLNKQGDVFNSVHSGFKYLNYLTEGFREGELVVLSGKTGEGKTTMSSTLTYDMALEGVQSLWFTYEISPRQFLKKFSSLPPFFMPQKLKESKLEWIEKRIIEAKAKFNINVVFIDHLHYIVPPSQIKNISHAVGEVMRKLKIMCVEHNIIIFLVAHVAKMARDTLPETDDLRDSSFVSQEADFVMFVSRGKKSIGKGENKITEYTNGCTILLKKNRYNGQLGNVYLNYDEKEKLFKDKEGENVAE